MDRQDLGERPQPFGEGLQFGEEPKRKAGILIIFGLIDSTRQTLPRVIAEANGAATRCSRSWTGELCSHRAAGWGSRGSRASTFNLPSIALLGNRERAFEACANFGQCPRTSSFSPLVHGVRTG